MKKCDFCAKEISYFEQYCCDECQEKANQYYSLIEKFGEIFSKINMVCIFGIPVGIFLFSFLRTFGTIVACSSCVILGATLVLLPFPSDGMISKFKIEKAMKITRLVGLGLILFAVVLFLFMVVFFNTIAD